MQDTELKVYDMRVLIVDDNEMNRMIAGTVLNRYGIVAESASGGQEAVELARTKSFDLIIMDYMMPGMNGFEACKQIRQFHNEKAWVPIVVFSSDRKDEILEIFRDVDVEDVLLKPIEKSQIEELLRKYAPAEKITMETKTQRADMAAKKIRLEEYLSKIDGLSYQKGIHFAMNNEDSYLQVLKTGVVGIKEAIDRLEQFNDKYLRLLASGRRASSPSGKESKQVGIDAHSMKGIYACFGVESLSLLAADVEQASRNGDFDYVARRMEDFIERNEAFIAELERTLNTYTNEVSENESLKVVPMAREEYLALWKETCYHNSRFEIGDVTTGLLKLRSATSNQKARDRLNDAIQATQMFDYGRIAKLLEEVPSQE